MSSMHSMAPHTLGDAQAWLSDLHTTHHVSFVYVLDWSWRDHGLVRPVLRLIGSFGQILEGTRTDITVEVVLSETSHVPIQHSLFNLAVQMHGELERHPKERSWRKPASR